MAELGVPQLIERLLEANRRYVAGSPAIPFESTPSLRLALVTCMDVRIDPLPLLGLGLGQAHVLRNAGARVTDDVLRSLVISQQALGTNTVILMPHTGCGVLGLDVRNLAPRSPTKDGIVPPLDFHPLHDLQTGLAEDLRLLRDSPWLLPDVEVHGFILDVSRGAVWHAGL